MKKQSTPKSTQKSAIEVIPELVRVLTKMPPDEREKAISAAKILLTGSDTDREKALDGRVDIGGNAKIYHSTFMLHGLPILYFPFATHPVEKESRQSGFLMPAVARSSTKGNVVGEAYYWAINRMMDLTLGAEYFSLRGWSQRGTFRAMPSETSYVDLSYFGVIDRGIGSPPLKEGGENVRLSAAGNVVQASSGANVRG